MENNDKLEEAWRELEQVLAQYQLFLTPEQQNFYDSLMEAKDPAFTILYSENFLNCEEATFYDVNQRYQKEVLELLRKLEEKKK